MMANLTFPERLTSLVASLPADLRLPGASSLRWAVLANGDTDPNDNVILYGFLAGQSHPALVAKVPRRPENAWVVQTEYERLKELWVALGEDAAKYVPRPLAYALLDGQPVLLLSYVAGESVLWASRRTFWRDEARLRALAVEAARTLRHVHECTATPVTSSEREALRDFPARAARFRSLFRLTPDEHSALDDVTQAIGDAESRADCRVLIQADFWHGNLIRNAAHGRLSLVDWQFARWSLDVSMDVYLFLLAAALRVAPYGTAEERTSGAVRVLATWRTTLIPAYLDAYGRPRRFGLLPPRRGMLACCVEKAVRPNLDFGYHHPDDRMWYLLFKALLDWPQEKASYASG